MSMLWYKLWADARALARQAIALMVLIGLGVMLFVSLYEAYQNLTITYNHVYDTARLADASVLFEAAPDSLTNKARSIPHVRVAMGRAVRDGALIQRGRPRERVMARFVGCPLGRRPEINDLLVIEGRYLGNGHEAVLEQQFARRNGYAIGDHIKGLYAMREREFTVVGFAISPEYIYPAPSKLTLFLAPGTFAVLFIEEEQARDWFGLGRQITELHCLTDRGREREVLGKLEGLARPYGVETSYTQEEQPSKRLLALDQQGFAEMSVFFPILFLGSAGLSLYGALSRIVRLQVTVIGTLRACGFSRREILVQHIAQGVIVATAGAIPAAAVGHALGAGMTTLYVRTLYLPLLMAPVHWGTITVSLVLAMLTGLAAAYLPARMVANLEPAVAMRGEVDSPRRLRLEQSLVGWTRWVSVAYRVPLRGIFRRASRTLLALAGIAGGASIIITTLGIYVSTLDAIAEFLTRTRHYQIDVQFTSPAGLPLARAVAALPGGRASSATVGLPVRVSSAWGTAELMLTGLERGQELLRARSVTGEAISVRAGAIWLPQQLARRLRVDPGDPVRVEWLRSTRKRRVGTTMQVAGLLDVALGGTAYGEYDDVRRSLAEASYPNSGFGAFIACDSAQAPAFRSRLERSDEVAFVMTTADLERQIEQQLGVTNIFIGVLLIFGSVLAGSAIYSVASISLLERTRELATLRTLGFSAGRATWLAGLELLVLAGLGLLVGIPFGAALNRLFIASFTTENMSFCALLPWWIYAATVGIVLALVVWASYTALQYLRQLDLAQATKARE